MIVTVPVPLPQAAPMLGPGIPTLTAPVPPLPPAVQMQGPGMAPLEAPLLPLAAQLQGLGLAPPVPTAAPSCSDTNVSPDADPNAPGPSSSRSPLSLKEFKKRIYTYTTPLKPGVGISAK
jgi:hypothetical protein